ncbi:Lsr2 dimerization domain-containing protein [Arthrobacter sp. SLBN-83]|uniref:Lsr2 dimerization domain-containing protein n=1 Tax=Arthrobacter sp. SLBN-83 TaxID=2768449 RepID=UPI0011520E14|nr:histone-like nucleoid-structuring protein Lsr2 [Arthrobacter sp. SLBN-83]
MTYCVLTTLVDDLDRSSAADETVRFALDGIDYEIDLTAVHAAELRSTLYIYVGGARRIRSRHLSSG